MGKLGCLTFAIHIHCSWILLIASNLAETRLTDSLPPLVYSWSGSHLLTTAEGATGTWTSPAGLQWCGTGAAAAGPHGGEVTFPWPVFLPVVLRWLEHSSEGGSSATTSHVSYFLQHFLKWGVAVHSHSQPSACLSSHSLNSWTCWPVLAEFDNTMKMLRRTKCFVFM